MERTVDLISGINGTLVGGAGFADAHVEQGFHFPGTGAVNVPDSSALDRAFLTMEAWIAPEMLPATPGSSLHDCNQRDRVKLVRELRTVPDQRGPDV